MLSAAHAADAVTVKVPLSRASWFWRGQPGGTGVTSIALSGDVPDPAVPAGDLAVAGPETPAAAGLQAGAIAASYLAFDLTKVPVGSTITSFVVSLPVDTKGITADVTGASMVACAVQTGWAGGLEASAYGGKPTDGCDVHSPKLKAVDGGDRYTVDIAEIAQRWMKPDGLNLGIAITDNPANTLTVYQVVFGPETALAALTAAVTYVAPRAGGGSSDMQDTVVVPEPGASAGSGGRPVITFEPLPPGMPAEVAHPPVATPEPLTPVVAMTVGSGDLSAPPIAFWIAVVLIVLLLGATTFVLAEPRLADSLRRSLRR